MTQINSKLIVGKRESVYDEFLLMNPLFTPILSLIGFGGSVISTTHKWYEDKLSIDKDAVNGAKTNSDTTITVDTGALFRPKQVIKIGNEMLYVTAVSGNDLTVTRAYGGTTAAVIADNAIIEIMFNLQEEGANARDGIYTPRVPGENITQIFEDTIEISGTAMAIAQYGVDDEYNKEKVKTQLKLAKQLENALVNGTKFEQDKIRMMGGIRNFIATNVTDAAAAEITWDMINNKMLEIYKAGGMKDATRHVLMCSAVQNTKITKLDKDLVRTTNDANTTGRNITSIVTNYGTLDIVPNINFQPDEVMILDLNRIEVKPLTGREFTHTYMGLTGDNIKGQVVGEYTLEFLQEQAHGRIRNLKTT